MRYQDQSGQDLGESLDTALRTLVGNHIQAQRQTNSRGTHHNDCVIYDGVPLCHLGCNGGLWALRPLTDMTHPVMKQEVFADTGYYWGKFEIQLVAEDMFLPSAMGGHLARHWDSSVRRLQEIIEPCNPTISVEL